MIVPYLMWDFKSQILAIIFMPNALYLTGSVKELLSNFALLSNEGEVRCIHLLQWNISVIYGLLPSGSMTSICVMSRILKSIFSSIALNIIFNVPCLSRLSISFKFESTLENNNSLISLARYCLVFDWAKEPNPIDKHIRSKSNFFIDQFCFH